MNRRLIIRSPEIRDRAASVVAGLPIGEPPMEVRIREWQEPRNLDQNAKLWAMLTDISNQVQWPVDGKMQYLSKEDWKIILTAGLNHSQRIAQGIEGGFVMLGTRTSRMTKKQMAELIELVQYFGDQHGVEWTDPKLATEYGEPL